MPNPSGFIYSFGVNTYGGIKISWSVGKDSTEDKSCGIETHVQMVSIRGMVFVQSWELLLKMDHCVPCIQIVILMLKQCQCLSRRCMENKTYLHMHTCMHLSIKNNFSTYSTGDDIYY